MSEIINMSDKFDNGNLWTPEQALSDAIKEHKEGGVLEGRKKVLILSLDDSNDEFRVTFIQAGLKMSQCVSLCETAKAIFLTEMGYINKEF